MTIPDEPPLERLKGADAYYDLLESSLLNQIIVEIAHITINNYFNKSAFEVAKMASVNNLDAPEAVPTEVKINSYEHYPDQHGKITSSMQNRKSIVLWVLLMSVFGISFGLFIIFKLTRNTRNQ